MIFPLVKFRLHAKDETHSSKFQQVMAIFVYQGEAKSQSQKSLKSRSIFLDFMGATESDTPWEVGLS